MSQAQSPEPRKIIAETRLIPGGAPDVKLQLINKRPDDLRRLRNNGAGREKEIGRIKFAPLG